MLTAINCLLECNFKPDRTVIVSVGFDEEGGAEQSYGARCLAERLLQVYGADGVEMIVRASREALSCADVFCSLTKALLESRIGSELILLSLQRRKRDTLM